MKKWYKAKIKIDIPDGFNCISEIKRYAGKYVYVSDDKESGSIWGDFQGRVNNIENTHHWNTECFSEMIEI